MIITAPLMLASGAALGFCYFSGLYWTLEKLADAEGKFRWLALSFLVRSSVLAAALYFLSGQDWLRLFLLAAGFTVSRIYWVRKMKKGTSP